MKNIHIIPTDKPSRLYSIDGKHKLANSTMAMDWYISSVGYKPHNIYITSDEEINEGDWFYDLDTKYVKIKQSWENSHLNFNGKKIILTTDQGLINEGVQAIDDEFLEWFVKNPSCEEVEIELFPKFSNNLYGIIIPKEEPKILTVEAFNKAKISYKEPKQETLEDASWKYNPLKKLDGEFLRHAFKEGAKWQAERSYSEEEVNNLLYRFLEHIGEKQKRTILNVVPNEWFDRNKKK